MLAQVVAMTLQYPNVQVLWSFDRRLTAELFARFKLRRCELFMIKEDIAAATDDQTVGMENFHWKRSNNSRHPWCDNQESPSQLHSISQTRQPMRVQA